MIEGLKIEVAGTELQEICDDRMSHHNERLAFYEMQITNLRNGGLSSNPNISGDPIRDLEQRRKDHDSRARYFLFLRDHVVTDQVYRLNESDLRALEITDHYR